MMDAGGIRDWDHRLPADSPDRTILARMQPPAGDPAPDVTCIATPSHTSLLFASEGMRVVIAADAAMTRDFFLARDYYFNTEAPTAAVASIERIATMADIIVPGHNNFFLNRHR